MFLPDYGTRAPWGNDNQRAPGAECGVLAHVCGERYRHKARWVMGGNDHAPVGCGVWEGLAAVAVGSCLL